MRFLVLQHAEHEGPGRYEKFAHEAGIKLDTVELWKSGYRLPVGSRYDAALVMGGPQSVYDDPAKYPSRDDELQFIQEFQGPMLGHCLGSQLIAKAFGGRVYPGPKKECGVYNVALRNEAGQSKIFSGFPTEFPVLHWHGDIFQRPDTATPLAADVSDHYNVEAFSCGNKIGVLWHWEMTSEMIDRLLEIDAVWFNAKRPGQIHHGNTADDVRRWAAIREADMEQYAKMLFDNFVSMARGY